MNKKILPVVLSLGVILIAAAFFAGGVLLLRNVAPKSINGLSQFADCSQFAGYISKSADTKGVYKSLDLNQPARESAGTSVPSNYTNVQVQGIDESDIFKTDGDYIYILKGSAVTIVRNDKGKLSKVIDVILPETGLGIFIAKERLVVRTAGQRSTSGYNSATSNLYIYDTSNIAKPTLIKQIVLEGNFVAARLKDDTVYLVYNFNPLAYVAKDTIHPVDYLPQVGEANEASDLEFKSLVDCKDIYFSAEHIAGSTIGLVFSYDLGNNQYAATAALTPADSIYMSYNAVYLANSYQGEAGCLELAADCDLSQGFLTNIHKFSLGKAAVDYTGTATVQGRLINQFAMDEYESNLRVALTNRQVGSNSIVVLDAKLAELGSLDKLGTNELLYAARFIGSKAYLVTFRQIDPFYVIDLSDPATPKALGEVKISGYSNYLHPVDNELILGIGQEVRNNRQLGLKLTVFDVGEAKPEILSSLEVGMPGTSSPAFTEHKAVTYSQAKHVLVLPVSVYGDFDPNAKMSTAESRTVSFTGFVQYKLTDKGLKEQYRYTIDAKNKPFSGAKARSFIVGDVVLMVDQNSVQSAGLETGRIIGKLSL